nr:MAG TPA: hypothetical protein [Caudoviricetes sp.]
MSAIDIILPVAISQLFLGTKNTPIDRMYLRMI